jgi:ABC-2 type transport system permease protein
MNTLKDALWIEARKALRSRVPVFTAIGFLIAPLACALAMLIYKDPEFARKAGLISAKANLMGGSADWPTFLGMLAQAVAIGGLMVFSLAASWLFGREFSDRTAKDLLAVPVSRTTLVLAKFVIGAVWMAALALLVYAVGLGLGALVGLPQGSAALLAASARTYTVTTILVIAAVTPVALLACIGRGYLLPVGIAMLTLALANVLALFGWGYVFPWSVPALYAGMTGEASSLEAISYWIVALTALGGVIGTALWWHYADQDR